MGLQRSDVSYQLQMLFKKFLLFFWPLYLMRDCSTGTQIEKIHAYNYNRENKHILFLPMLNCFLFSGVMLSILNMLEVFLGNTGLNVYFVVICALVVTISFIAGIMLFIAYVFLNREFKF